MPPSSDRGPLRLADAAESPNDLRLEAARPKRSLPPGIEAMLSIDELAAWLNCSRRWLERERSAGRFPKPDAHVGKCPRWLPRTILRWGEEGGR
jgi:hypothetical protein